MRPKLLVALLLATAAGAAVQPGENLLINGNLDGPGAAFPTFWEQGGSNTSRLPTGGPEQTAALVFSNPDGRPGISSFCRQHDQQIVAGETYKLSADILTRGFKSGHCGIIIHDNGWHKAVGPQTFPADAPAWQHVEQTFKLPESQNNVYGVAIFAVDYVGEIRFARVKLEAISPGALAGSAPPRAAAELLRPRLVAWQPLLNQIPLAQPQLTWRFFGQTARPLAGYDCVATLDGGPARTQPLAPELNTLDLTGLAAGDHTLDLAIVERATGAKIWQAVQTITLRPLAPVDTTAHRRLNNLVVELLRQPLPAAGPATSATFDNPRDGWVWIQIAPAAASATLEARLDQDDVVVTAGLARPEVFRELPRGRHTLQVRGARGGTLVVRSIAEVFNYPACADSQIPQNGKYDWDFLRQHVLPAVTTLNGGNLPEQHRAEVRQLGHKWLANVGTTDPRDAADLVARMSASPGLTAPWYDGITNDEQFFGHPALIPYTAALRQVPNPAQRLIYTWIVGKPAVPGLHSDFISASLNASRGRGRLLFEIYCASRRDEQDATNYLTGRLDDTMLRLAEYFPNAAAGSAMILGNFNQIPIISLDVDPAVDYKVYLDLQLQRIATQPPFRDLAMTGYWGSYYDDEELYRWSMALLRHYCIEGQTTLLSQRYGYRYNPGHLRNGDFADGLQGWTASPAAAVRPDQLAGYGANSQRRWGATGRIGDTFAVLQRGADQPSTLAQTATGLTPGQVYTLQFVTVDHPDLVARRVAPQEHRLRAEFGPGAELLPAQSYVHVDRRTTGAEAAAGWARVNLHHLRFRATAATCQITFTDATAAPGTATALNYVMLKPYYQP
ncbi:MAG: hypothetical protein IT204_12720 [Fimbriimonadaceae bacterium]|nr:hypothetical protein [Fimbriimonadaceae bacterium]